MTCLRPPSFLTASWTPRILSGVYTLLAHAFRLSRTDSNFRLVSYSVDNYIAYLAIYSFDFIALGSTLKYNCKCSTHPNVHAPCLIMRLLSGGRGEQQDDSSCDMRNLGKWDLVMEFSVTPVFWSLVHGYVGTFCILKGTKCQVIAQILVKILIILQNCNQVPQDRLFIFKAFCLMFLSFVYKWYLPLFVDLAKKKFFSPIASVVSSLYSWSRSPSSLGLETGVTVAYILGSS